MSREKKIISRLPIGLDKHDNALLIELQAVMQKRLGKRLAWAQIMRIALRTQAKSEGVKCK